jgi:predicted alpha/beta-fold hydrolase
MGKMVVGARLEDFQRARRHTRLQPMRGEGARRDGQEPVYRPYEKPPIHEAMLGFTTGDRNPLANISQTRELAAPMTYFVTTSDGYDIAYDCQGDGPPVVLIHGFGANRNITWANTNWYQTILKAGHKLVAIDCRGHGESTSPTIPTITTKDAWRWTSSPCWPRWKSPKWT